MSVGFGEEGNDGEATSASLRLDEDELRRKPALTGSGGDGNGGLGGRREDEAAEALLCSLGRSGTAKAELEGRMGEVAVPKLRALRNSFCGPLSFLGVGSWGLIEGCRAPSDALLPFSSSVPKEILRALPAGCDASAPESVASASVPSSELACERVGLLKPCWRTDGQPESLELP